MPRRPPPNTLQLMVVLGSVCSSNKDKWIDAYHCLFKTVLDDVLKGLKQEVFRIVELHFTMEPKGNNLTFLINNR